MQTKTAVDPVSISLGALVHMLGRAGQKALANTKGGRNLLSRVQRGAIALGENSGDSLAGSVGYGAARALVPSTENFTKRRLQEAGRLKILINQYVGNTGKLSALDYRGITRVLQGDFAKAYRNGSPLVKEFALSYAAGQVPGFKTIRFANHKDAEKFLQNLENNFKDLKMSQYNNALTMRPGAGQHSRKGYLDWIRDIQTRHAEGQKRLLKLKNSTVQDTVTNVAEQALDKGNTVLDIVTNPFRSFHSIGNSDLTSKYLPGGRAFTRTARDLFYNNALRNSFNEGLYEAAHSTPVVTSRVKRVLNSIPFISGHGALNDAEAEFARHVGKSLHGIDPRAYSFIANSDARKQTLKYINHLQKQVAPGVEYAPFATLKDNWNDIRRSVKGYKYKDSSEKAYQLAKDKLSQYGNNILALPSAETGIRVG